MNKLLFFIVTICFLTSKNFGQEFNKSINKDSLLQTVVKNLSEDKKAELVKAYNEGNEPTKEFLLFMFSMGTSSKKQLTANIDSNFDKINFLKSEYLKLVPKDYSVSIEFNPANKIINTKESIDFTVEHTAAKQSDVKQDWNLEYNSKKLVQMLKPLNWTNETLQNIKKLLRDANCISISSGEVTTIGFARSGMGKYSYKLFDKKLTNDQIKQYNDGCNYIFYKDNIVLEYGGGATGPQCFPD